MYSCRSALYILKISTLVVGKVVFGDGRKGGDTQESKGSLIIIIGRFSRTRTAAAEITSVSDLCGIIIIIIFSRSGFADGD